MLPAEKSCAGRFGAVMIRRMNRAVRLGDSAAEIPRDVYRRVADDGIIQRFAARRDGQNLAKTIRVMMNGTNEP